MIAKTTRFKADPTVHATLGFTVVLALSVMACGQGPQPDASETAAASPPETAAAGRSEAPAEISVGSASFTVDGNEKRFEHLPDAECVYTKFASSIWAYPKSGTTEGLAIHFTSMDLKQLTFPADLPLPRDTTKPMDPMTYGATTGFGYIDAAGVEWAGPGRVYVESYGKDGVIRGTFDQVTLPQVDKEQPGITLSGGTFSARISSPW